MLPWSSWDGPIAFTIGVQESTTKFRWIGGRCDPSFAFAVIAVRGGTGAERGPLHHNHRQREISVCDGGAGGAAEVGGYSRHQHAGLLRQRAEEAGRQVEHGGGGQSAGGAVLR